MDIETKRKVTSRDFSAIAEYVSDEYTRRKSARGDRERDWDEVDRQIRMNPDISYKKGKGNDWMPEMELPNQAQTLEVLTADARRMIFPDAGSFFCAHAMVTDEYLSKVDFQGMISGDENDVPSRITQDNADKLVEGVLANWHGQYDFDGHVDQINADAFKYGMGLGRSRLVTKEIFSNEARGVVKKSQKMPVLFPFPIRYTYPDDRLFLLMNEGQMVGPSYIFWKQQNINDLRLAANKGNTDPENEYGGWMPNNLKGLEGDKDNNVVVLEYEGDLIVPRKTTGSLFFPSVIATVVLGSVGDKAEQRVVRFRFIKKCTYIEFPYHREDIDSPYPTSPLMKGMPIQKAAVDALNRLLMVSALNAQPPIGYSKDDFELAASGGPRVHPGAKWKTTDEIKTHEIGDPSALFAVYQGLLMQYSDVTGVNAPRLGAQTISHTTAYAKQTEIDRGTIRTVDYVRSLLKGPMAHWLSLEYEMTKDCLKGEINIYLDPYKNFVRISRDSLPEEAVFDVYGSGGPQEELVKYQRRQQALQSALGIEQLRAQAIQLGIEKDTVLDFEKLIDQTLRDGGYTDIDAVKRTQSVSQGSAIASSLAGTPEGVGIPAGAALQTLAVDG